MSWREIVGAERASATSEIEVYWSQINPDKVGWHARGLKHMAAMGGEWPTRVALWEGYPVATCRVTETDVFRALYDLRVEKIRDRARQILDVPEDFIITVSRGG